MIGCQWPGCEALAEVKTREMDASTGVVIWWRYLCLVHLEEEYRPWLALMKGWRERLTA
jgi:hypothetical protein